MNKIKKYLLLISFSTLLLIFFLMDVFNSDKPFSQIENRNLAQYPKFTLNKYINNEFSDKYTSYIEDQFIGRNLWINLKSRVEYLLGKTENNNIIYGEDNYLFEKYYSYDINRLNNNLKSIKTFAEKCNSYLSLLIIPNSYVIYDNLVPYGLKLVNQASIINDIYYNLKLNNSNINTVNILNSLSNNKENYIYYRTDHHWTSYGAYIAYSDYIKSLSLTPIELNKLGFNTINNFYGTYYNKSKFFKSKSDIITVYETPNLEIEIDDKNYSTINDDSKFDSTDKYSGFLWGNNGFTKIINKEIDDSRRGSKILVFKDSYANSFIQFLCYNFETIDIVDLRHYKGMVSSLLNSQYDNILIMYNFSNLVSDINITRIKF